MALYAMKSVYCSDFDECPNGEEMPWHSDNIDHFIGWAYAGIPARLMLITVVTCNTMIYRIARKTLRWSFNSGHMQDAQKQGCAQLPCKSISTLVAFA